MNGTGRSKHDVRHQQCVATAWNLQSKPTAFSTLDRVRKKRSVLTHTSRTFDQKRPEREFKLPSKKNHLPVVIHKSMGEAKFPKRRINAQGKYLMIVREITGQGATGSSQGFTAAAGFALHLVLPKVVFNTPIHIAFFLGLM